MSADSLLGKMRGLQQCATPEGAFSILAIDHRDNLRQALSPAAPAAVPAEDLAVFKREVVAAVAPASSAILLDPEYGLEAVIQAGALPGTAGLILALERTGYSGDPTARRSEFLPGWDVGRAAHVGANAVKLLVYYHPDAPTAAEIAALVAQVAASCQEVGLPFFLEILSYPLDPGQRHLPAQDRQRVVLESARRLTAIPGVDVLKAEFPLDIAAVPDGAAWLVACRELSAASRVPWVLLSAGVDFETYLRQVAAATQGGASGVAVGRAVWNEATRLLPAERHRFLTTVARARMERVTAVCRALARPWRERSFADSFFR
jgi:tagatose 1,6-diphosphate aldolase